jgi:hypothetical protein
MFSRRSKKVSHENPGDRLTYVDIGGIEAMMLNHMKRICRRASSFPLGAANASLLEKEKAITYLEDVF